MTNFPSHLWHVLVQKTVRKAQEFVKEREGRKRYLPPPRSPEHPIVAEIADPSPLSELDVVADAEIEHLLSLLDGKGDLLRYIATWKWQGYSNEEIARMLGCSVRTVRRQLWLIRTIWTEEEAG